MRHLFLILLTLALSLQAEAQQLIGGNIRDLGRKKVFLLSFSGERTTRIDSVMPADDGRFVFRMGDFRLPGLYRVSWGKDAHLDFIWNREDVDFITNANNTSDSTRFLQSEENRIFTYYSAIDRMSQTKQELLAQLIDFYPEKDRFYHNAAREFEELQHNQTRILDSLRNRHPSAYAIRMFMAYQIPFLSSALTREERIGYLRQHYFDKVDFRDTALLRSPVFANKAISYLSLYSNNRLNQKQLETEFIKAVTVIMSAAAVSPEVYKYLLDYLVGGFDKYHFDEVITYMAENFSDPFACEDQARKTALQKKLETFKKIAIGKTAPDLEIPDLKGNPVRLSALESKLLLLVFWSTECPHCVEMIPKLKALNDARKNSDLMIVTVSLDTSRAELEKFSADNQIGWLNLCDFKGFDSRAADDYNIYATPTMFLLDGQKTILAKPITIRELEQALAGR